VLYAILARVDTAMSWEWCVLFWFTVAVIYASDRWGD